MGEALNIQFSKKGGIKGAMKREFKKGKNKGAKEELDEIEKRFKLVSENGFATPKLAIEFVGFIIEKRRKELQ